MTDAPRHGIAVRALHAVLGLGVIGMVVLNVVNAVARYAGLPMLTGADELLVYAMIWIVMVGAVLAARSRSHLAIDLLPLALPPGGARAVRIVTDAVTCAVCGFMAWHSYAFVARISAIGQTSMGLGLPMTVPHAAILAGFAGMSAVALVLLVADLRGRS